MRRPRVLALGPIGALTLLAVVVSAQEWQLPRTEWDDPDMEGTWLSTNPQGLPFQRVSAATDDAALLRELVDAGAVEAGLLNEGVPVEPRIEERRRELSEWRRTHSRPFPLVVDPPDGRLPPMTAAGQARARAAWRSSVLSAGPWNSAADLGPVERCISRGPLRSMLPSFDYHGIQIVQSPGYVVLRTEAIHEARVVPLDERPALPPDVRGYMGDSRGHWENNQLVVVTTNVNGRVGGHLNGNETPMSQQLTLTERFDRVAAGRIDYWTTVDDPGTWQAPWTVALSFTRDTGYVFSEYACHEGNYPLRGILSAARAGERR